MKNCQKCQKKLHYKNKKGLCHKCATQNFSEDHKRKLSESHKGLKQSEDTKRKHSEAMKKNPIRYWLGKKQSQESIDKRAVALKGRKRPKEAIEKFSLARKGHLVSQETRKKISLKLKGRVFSKEVRANMGNAHWKGGPAVSRKKNKARRRALGFDPINEPFLGSEGHHIDKQHVIFIPKELHRSVWHSLDKPETMEQINTKVICWLLGVKTFW